MLYIKSLEQAVPVFKALGSDIRIRLIQTLLEHQEMNMNELATASRYNIPVIEVVFNNNALGMVRQWQNLFYGERYSSTTLYDKVDFVKLAEAMGAKAKRVETIEEFEAAFKEAVASNEPYLLDCIIDSDDKVWPMVAPGGSISDAFNEEDLEKQKQEESK